MRTPPHDAERFRLERYSSIADGNNGAFMVPCGDVALRCIVSDGGGWEHVSVSLPKRCPTWIEMCRVKKVFWEDDEPVMQLHPPQSAWVNNHEYCLHLWKPIGAEIPLPKPILVGIPK